MRFLTFLSLLGGFFVVGFFGNVVLNQDFNSNTVAKEAHAVISNIFSAEEVSADEGENANEKGPSAADDLQEKIAKGGSSFWGDSVGKALFGVLAGIARLIIGAEGFIITLVVEALGDVLSYDQYFSNPAVAHGWVAIRDLANTFLVFVLIVIGFGTLLNRPTYSYKELLPKLLVAAILINFSKVIAGIFLDFSQVVMLSFYAGFEAILGGSILAALGIPEITTFYDVTTSPDTGADKIGMLLISTLMAIVFLFFVMMTLVILFVVFIFRMVMIWLLLVLSPLPYVLGLLPKGKSYADRWWSEYINYLVLGPLLTFFLWLSFVAMADLRTSTGLEEGTAKTTASGEKVQKQENVGQLKIMEPVALTSYITAIALLLGGLSLSQSMAGAAGGAMSSARSGFKRWTRRGLTGTAKLGWLGTKAGAKGVDTLIGKTASLAGRTPADKQRFSTIGRRIGRVGGAAIGAGIPLALTGGIGAAVLGTGAIAAPAAAALFGRKWLNNDIKIKGKNIGGKKLKEGMGNFMNKIGMDKEARQVSQFFSKGSKKVEDFFALNSMDDSIDSHVKSLESEGIDHEEALNRSKGALNSGTLTERTMGDVLYASSKKKLDGDTIQMMSSELSGGNEGKMIENQVALGNLGALRKGLGDAAFSNLIHKGKIKASDFDKATATQDHETVMAFLNEQQGDNVGKSISTLSSVAGSKKALKENMKQGFTDGKLSSSVDEKGGLTNAGKTLAKLGLLNEGATAKDGFIDAAAFQKHLKGMSAKDFGGIAEGIEDLELPLQKAVVNAATVGNMRTATAKGREAFFKVAVKIDPKGMQKFANEKNGFREDLQKAWDGEDDLFSQAMPNGHGNDWNNTNLGELHDEIADRVNKEIANKKFGKMLDKDGNARQGKEQALYDRVKSLRQNKRQAEYADLADSKHVEAADRAAYASIGDGKAAAPLGDVPVMGETSAKSLAGGIGAGNVDVNQNLALDPAAEGRKASVKEMEQAARSYQKLWNSVAGDSDINDAFKKNETLKASKFDLNAARSKTAEQLEESFKNLKYHETRNIAEKIVKKIEKSLKKSGKLKDVGDMNNLSEHLKKLQKSLNSGDNGQIQQAMAGAINSGLRPVNPS